jgi:hypothetical protein
MVEHTERRQFYRTASRAHMGSQAWLLAWLGRRLLVDWRDCLVAAGVALITWFFYVRTLLPGLGSRDTAELQWVVPTLSLAHPTGYPLYTLLGWLWCQLPLGGTPAWRMNLFSALAAALCVGVIYYVARAIGQRRLVAAAAALALGASRAFWSQATIAEVYALAALLQALLLLALVRWRAGRNPHAGRGWPLWTAGLLVGLGLAHHRAIILMLPGAALFVIISLGKGLPSLSFFSSRKFPIWELKEQGELSILKEVGLAIAAILAGCLLYLYVPLRAPGWMQTWPQVWDHITGASLSGMFFDPARLRAEGLGRVLDLAWRFLWPQFLPFGALLALLGLARVWRRDAGLAALLTSAYIAVCAFCAAYYVDDIEVFFIPAHVLAALLLGEGAMWVLERWKVRTFERSSMLTFQRAASLALLLLPVLLVYRNYGPVRALNLPTAEAEARRIMAAPIEPGALVVGDWYATEGPHYLQAIEGLRPDLQLTGMAGRAEIVSALEHGRAVYLTKPDLSLGLEQSPAGPLWRVGRAPLAASSAADWRWADGMALTGYTLASGPYTPGAPVPVTLQWEARAAPRAGYTLFVHLIGPDGQIWGQHDAPPSAMPTDQWRAGQRLLELCAPALKPDAPPGRYRVTLGWYEYPSLRRALLAEANSPTPGADVVTLGEIEVAAPLSAGIP